MASIEIQAQDLIQDTLKSIHHSLSRHPSASESSRDLSPIESQLMQILNQDSYLYQTLLKVLAIDSYATGITKHSSLLEQCSAFLTILLENMTKMQDVIKKNGGSTIISQQFKQAYHSLIKIIELNQQLCPKSIYSQKQSTIIMKQTRKNNIQGLNQDYQTMQQKLLQDNHQLREQLQLNNQKFLEMQFKLTTLLKQNQGARYAEDNNNYNQNGQYMNHLELREELSLKETEIERMNEEFSYEIEKYNTVYDAMKRELQELKAYQNIDLIQQIEHLETEIVRLREERERDQLIIKQLRSDGGMRMSGTHSPRNANRFNYNSRYNY